MSESSALNVPPLRVERAIRLSYAQAMLSAIYGASTSGMFLIGYALRLGADNVHIGLMSTIPTYMVCAQLLTSAAVERGVSRRKLAIAAAICNVSAWALIILIPYALAGAATAVKVGALIAIITLVTLFAHATSNARGSWVGELIPATFRGTFFGRVTMYAGIIGVVFALMEGTFLDHVKHMGIGAFSWLFGFGMLFGLASALLFIPQPDIALPPREASRSFLTDAREFLANRPFKRFMVYQLIISINAIASPFYITYLLRDLKLPFLGVGLVNSIATLTSLMTAPFWGRVVDRYGCRPVIIACTVGLSPLNLVWIWLTSPARVYATFPVTNLIGGFVSAGMGVAGSTLVYKITPSAGRSVQFALYSMIISLTVAPLPTLGGYVPHLLNAAGIHADLRAVFYITVPVFFAAAWVARGIKEPDSRSTGELVRNLPGHLRRPRELRP